MPNLVNWFLIAEMDISHTESLPTNENTQTATVLPSRQDTGGTKGDKSTSQPDKTEENKKKRRINASEV